MHCTEEANRPAPAVPSRCWYFPTIPVACSDPCPHHRVLMPETARRHRAATPSFLYFFVQRPSFAKRPTDLKGSELSASRAPKYRAAKPRNGWLASSQVSGWSAASPPAPRTRVRRALARDVRCQMGRLPIRKYRRFHGHKTTHAGNPDNPDSRLIRDAQIFCFPRLGRLSGDC